MTFKDMLSMSISNLWRRKLRTFLTVLGVLIGTASIVAMLSIALGMKAMIIEQYQSEGAVNEITVTEGYSETKSADTLKLTESNIKKFTDMEHVTSVQPVLQLDLNMSQGKYSGYATLYGVPKSQLKEKKLASGSLPDSTNSNRLDVIMGNTVITNFYNQDDFEGSSYYTTGKLPNVDFSKPSMKYTVYNENAVAPESVVTPDTSGSGDATAEPQNTVDDTVDYSQVALSIKVAGVIEGGPDEYSMGSDYAYVDIDQLKAYLKKNFKRDQMPGQSKNSKGQPFKEWVYNSVTIKVDDSDNVDMVMQTINDLGFSAQSNKELIESAQKTVQIIELVLGAIGMIAFLVAAIGIANTMMMSTYERTKEIGVMKVLGCDMRDIRRLFLSEAGFIGFLGGAAGLLFTMLLSFIGNSVFRQYMAQDLMGAADAKISVIPWWLMLAAIVFATLMGMVAGFFPANRAMRLSPLAAIRNE